MPEALACISKALNNPFAENYIPYMGSSI